MQASKAYEKRWWTLGVVSLSLLIISIDNTILNVALPTIERDLSADSRQLQWIVDSYTLVFAGLLLFAGALGDYFGRRRALVLGLVDLRRRLDVGGDGRQRGRVDHQPRGDGHRRRVRHADDALDPDERRSRARSAAKAIGIWAAVAGLGVAIGPVTGGFLIEQLDWTWVFLMNIPIALAAVMMAPVVVPESSDPDEAALDPMGAALSIGGLGVLDLVDHRGGRRPRLDRRHRAGRVRRLGRPARAVRRVGDAPASSRCST